LTDFGIGDLIASIHAGEQGGQMKHSTQNRLKGTAHEIKGAVKQKAGQLTNNRKLEAKGLQEKITGKIQNKIGQVEKVFTR